MRQLLEKLVCMMTGEELLALHRMFVPEKIEVVGAQQPRLVYGLRGLAQLLGCSHTTANKIKHDPRLNGCYSQAGKKIVFDADKVLTALKH